MPNGYDKALDTIEESEEDPNEYEQAVTRISDLDECIWSDSTNNKNNSNSNWGESSDNQIESNTNQDNSNELIDSSKSMLYPVVGFVFGLIILGIKGPPGGTIIIISILYFFGLIIKKTFY